MIKGQIHEEFKTFSGDRLAEAVTKAIEFAKTVAAKSLAVLYSDGSYYVSLGYRTDETPYTIAIVEYPIENPQRVSLDEQIAEAIKDVDGDVVCHAFFEDADAMMLGLLLHV
jgi:hypothetical protein